MSQVFRVDGEEDMPNIATTKKQYIGILLWWQILSQGDSRCVADGVEELQHLGNPGD